MPEHTSSAIIIDLRDYGEADRIVTAYTRDAGKITGIAKSAKKSQKRFGAALDLFASVVMSFFVKETSGLVRIDQCRLVQAFPGIQEDITRMSYGSYMAELTKEMSAEGVSHPEVFDGLNMFLSLLDKAGPREDYLRMFEMRLIAAAGFRPVLTACCRCRREWLKGETFRFSNSMGGVVCPACSAAQQQTRPLSLGTAKLLEQACNLAVEKIQRLMFSAQALSESSTIVPSFIRYHLGKELNSYKFLEKIRQSACEGARK